MTNSQCIADELNKKCDGSHEHQALVSGRAKDAARYPEGLCRAVCRGLVKQRRRNVMNLSAVVEVKEPRGKVLPDPEEHHDKEEAELTRKVLCGLTHVGTMGGPGKHVGDAWDDITGMPLEGDKVKRPGRMRWTTWKRRGYGPK